MTRIESNTVEIANSSEKVFAFLSDFNNFQKMMPPQVDKWTATSNECSFEVKGMAVIGMKIVERKPPHQLNIVSNGKVPFDFTLAVTLTPTGENSCKGQLVFEAKLNPMIRMMVEKPLGNFFNMLAEKMKEIKD